MKTSQAFPPTLSIDHTAKIFQVNLRNSSILHTLRSLPPLVVSFIPFSSNMKHICVNASWLLHYFSFFLSFALMLHVSGSMHVRNRIMSQHYTLQFIATFHNDKWPPYYPDFARFDYDRASYQIRLRQDQGRLFFADGLKHLRKHLGIYESVTINFMACEHRRIFNLHFTPPLEQQACDRPLLAARMHVWTLELTQSLLGDPKPLVLPPLAAIHLPSCGFHMTILRKFDPPLQWPVLPVGPGFHDKRVA
ncbi:hypothetical protein JHK86_019019 [Glycine max]|nr:hypothetical protein JHK86_019019 [Glycine max]